MKLLILRPFFAGLSVAALAIAATPPRGVPRVYAANELQIAVNVRDAGPRAVEETTQKAVARDYTAAWQSMSDALDKNRSDYLAANFVGTASEKLNQTISEQQKAGVHQRIQATSHSVNAVFYSQEGSAIQLHDTANVQIQLLDGDKIVSSQNATVKYVVLMTAAESSWKVRVLEAVPSF